MTLSLVFGVTTYAQEKSVISPVAVEAATTDRARDRLIGPVRRVRVERAKLLFKDGKWIEGPRTTKAVLTYDSSGKLLDTASATNDRESPVGKEQHRYDEKGNVVETTLWSDDGLLTGKEVFAYEFDELDNWKSMTKSIAVYENGNISYEPVEITYRTFTYYFDQSVAKLTSATEEGASTLGNENMLAHASPPTAKPLGQASSETLTTHESSSSTSSDPLSVVHLSEEALRKSLVELPEANYPAEAKLANVEGKVEVHVIINEKGQVTAARAISGSPLLTEAAAKAVGKARFAPHKLTTQPAQVFGLLTYEFSLARESTAVIETPDTEKLVTTDVRASEYRVSPSIPPIETFSSSVRNDAAWAETENTLSNSAPTARDPMVSGTSLEKGIASLSAANYEAAVGYFRQIIQRDPSNASAYYQLGLAYSSMGKHQETINAYKKAIELSRTIATADAFYRLGSAYLATGDYFGAVEPLKQAIYIIRAQVLEPHSPRNTSGDPSEAEVHHALGLSYYGKGSFRNATNEFQEAVRLKPGFQSAHYGLGLSLLATGDKRAAEREEAALRKLGSPLANKLAGALITPAVQRNRVF
jgi:TonB family protein